MEQDGLPSGIVPRVAAIALVVGLIAAVYLLVVPPTLPNERERTGAAAPSAAPVTVGTRPAGATGASGESSASPMPAETPAAASPSPAGSPQPARRHTIQAGDTLLAIAEQYDTTVDAIRAANPGLSETGLMIGQEITIPPGQ